MQFYSICIFLFSLCIFHFASVEAKNMSRLSKGDPSSYSEPGNTNQNNTFKRKKKYFLTKVLIQKTSYFIVPGQY